MSIYQGQTNVFKTNLLSGLENFAAGTPYTYYIALYTGNANINQDTTAYTTFNEVTGGGYVAGGIPLTISQVPTVDTTNSVAYISFNNAVWTSVTFTARAALIYNYTTGAAEIGRAHV